MPASVSAIAALVAAEITHVALVDDNGDQIGSRQAVTATATSGNVRLDSDVTFSISGGTTVAGWTAHDAATDGTSYGGDSLTPEAYTGAGEYVLTGSATGFTVAAS